MATKASTRFDPIKQLIELQALAQMQIAKADERIARADERMARTDERFAKLDQESKERFARIERTLAALVRMLEHLPDAVREKIGFATPQT